MTAPLLDRISTLVQITGDTSRPTAERLTAADEALLWLGRKRVAAAVRRHVRIVAGCLNAPDGSCDCERWRELGELMFADRIGLLDGDGPNGEVWPDAMDWYPEE